MISMTLDVLNASACDEKGTHDEEPGPKESEYIDPTVGCL
jgi:hypothetical protein